MATSLAGPAIQDRTIDRAKDLFFDTLRFKLIDRERTTDDDPAPGVAEVRSARGGPSQASVGFVNGSGIGTALVGLVIVGGLAWAATR